MMGKLTANQALVQLAARMLAAGETLDAAQRSYEAAVRAVLPARVDVKYENFASDQCVRRTQKRAELADDRSNGPIATAVFPDGSAAVVRLQGASQVAEMKDLEGRIKAIQDRWAEAPAAMAEVAEHRQRYDDTLEARRAAGQAARDLRAARNAEKARFLETYTEIARRVQAEFPRDKAMQDLFFDDVRGRSTSQVADGDQDVPEDEAPASTPA
jgi:hypothetical protein